MKSATATNRLSSPMSKRNVFTTITPLPPHIGRAAVVAFLHDYEAMIDVNPLVTDRYRIPPPADADLDEASCVWYQLTDAVAMPWTSPTSASAPASASLAPHGPSKPKGGNVSYTCVFHQLPNGLQTHCRAPLGVDIRDRWTVGGTQPGEPRQPIELGLDALGAPASGLYLREDVDLRCNRIMAGFVKKTLKKAHVALVDRVSSYLAAEDTTKPLGKDSSGSCSSSRTSGDSFGSSKTHAASLASTPNSTPSPALSLPPYNAYSPQQHQNQMHYQAFQPPPQHQQPLPYRQHQQPHAYTHHVPAPQQGVFVPAALTVGPAPQQMTLAQLQNQQYQRSVHPHFPPYHYQQHTSLDFPSLSPSPQPSLASASTSTSVSTSASFVSPYSRFSMNASPLTQLQQQLPKVAVNNCNSHNGDLAAAKHQRLSLYNQLLPPLTYSASEVVGESRKYGAAYAGNDGSCGRNGISVTALPIHDYPSLCPQPLRVGRRSSADQPQQPQQTRELHKPTQSTQPTQETAHPDYPVMNPYEDDDDDSSPILVGEGRERHKGPYSPTVFAELDGTKLASAMSGAESGLGL